MHILPARNPSEIIEKLHETTLDKYWSKYGRDRSISMIVLAVPAYVMGMIGYAFDALCKLFWALRYSLACLASYVKGEDACRKGERKIVCLDSWAALGIAIVGIVVPPLAYRLDAAAMRTMKNMLQTHRTYVGSQLHLE